MSYRYMLGRDGERPLVALAMNPSAARDETSDRTVNRIIKVSQDLGYDGWFVFNIYPERATKQSDLAPYNQELGQNNLQELRDFLLDRGIREIWGTWGDLHHESLVTSKAKMLAMLEDIGVRVFYFGTLTKQGNPRHPIQRQEKWDFTKRSYL